MAEPHEPSKVKLICGIISASKELFAQTLDSLQSAFGPADIVSDLMDFNLTHYYDREMGQPLYRQFVAFRNLVMPDAVIEAKRLTNEMERQFAMQAHSAPHRTVNLDPGYVDLPKLVLASMKNFSHRIYLGRGVFAEVTLMYNRNGQWESLTWTFPDYASGRYHSFFTKARTELRRQLEQESNKQ